MSKVEVKIIDDKTVLIVSVNVFGKQFRECSLLLERGQIDEIQVSFHGTPTFRFTMITPPKTGKLSQGPVTL